MIVTIDGPSGTGKTTVAKRVAERLHFAYFDTGAMYRAITWQALQKKTDLRDEKAVLQLLHDFNFRIEEKNGEKRYLVGATDVTEAIRAQEITARVSEVAALLPIRQALWKIQRDFAAHGGDSVFEGRDIGSVVFPNAEKKFFLMARPEIRAKRRLDELLAKHPPLAKTLDIQKMLRDIMRRDEYDSTREHAPLTCPKDAQIIDTSDLSLDEVVEKILELVINPSPK